MRMIFWIGLVLLVLVTVAFAILWVQGGALAVGLFVGPLSLGFILAIVLVLIGLVKGRRRDA